MLLQLTRAVGDHAGLHLLLSLREECLAPMLPYERLLGRSSRTRFRLLPLSRAAALDAVTRLREGSGRSFAPGAAERLVDRLGPLPLAGRDEAEEARFLEAGDTPIRVEALVILGEVAAGTGEVETSRRHFEEAADMFAKLQRFTGVTTALGGEGRLWLRRGEYDRAVERLHTALSWAPDDAPVQLALGETLWHQGNPRSALALLNRIVSIAGTSPPRALALRGEILADLGRSAEALRDLERVRPHRRPGTIAARALALALEGRLDAADREGLDALAEAPGSGPVLLRVARVQAMLGEARYAEELVSRALDAVSPGLPPHLRRQAEGFPRERRSA